MRHFRGIILRSIRLPLKAEVSGRLVLLQHQVEHHRSPRMSPFADPPLPRPPDAHFAQCLLIETIKRTKRNRILG